MRWSGDWRGKGGSEDTWSSTEVRAARHMGTYDCLGKERMEMKLQGAQQSVQQQGIRVSAGVWGREGWT